MIEIKLDTTELQTKLSTLNEAYETALMTSTQEIAKELHKALLLNTPVITGNLRKEWSSGENLMFTVERIPNGFQVTLINNARTGSENGFQYASAVNYGHKTPNGGWVAGRFFVERSEAQTEPKCYDIIDKNIRKYFMRWLSGK